VLVMQLLPFDSQLALRAFRQPDEPLPTLEPTIIATATETSLPTEENSPTPEPTATFAASPTETSAPDIPSTRTAIPTLDADDSPLTVQTNTPRPPLAQTPEQ
jgi:hypothetical protein